ncbi:MAG: glycosyltransferase family 1 protein [Candidatus Moranbacteria bacterium]|nr:glycosyltransferase family 1 protein [Candidatus Moranbacteria bacterium]
MRIGFDARCLEEENISGVGEYALELLKNILKLDSLNQYIIFSNSFRQKNGRHFEWINAHPNAKLKRFSFPNKVFNLCFWYLNWPKIDKLIGGVDVFFAPNINFLSVSDACRLVTTFHDLSFERYPHFFPLKTRLWHKYFVNPRKISRIAKGMIAVSESTKKDLEEIYQVRKENIQVIPHGISQDFRAMEKNDPKLAATRKKYGLPQKFIFFLGNIEPRKNISSIIEAYKSVVLKNPKLSEYKLVLAGNINSLCRDLIEKEDVKICGYIEREDRPYVYNLASLFVYPSFFEGFGLPILEAMACGTPVIASNNSSLPEVSGKATLPIDPNRPAELAEAMENILIDENLYNKFKKRGIAQAQKFSWEKCAKETLAVIHQHK